MTLLAPNLPNSRTFVLAGKLPRAGRSSKQFEGEVPMSKFVSTHGSATQGGGMFASATQGGGAL